MFAPPPKPSRSKAKLDSHRAHRVSKDETRYPRSPQRTAGRPNASKVAAEESLHGAGLIRRIAAFGKERASEPRSVDISAPLKYSAPQIALPPIPRLSPILPQLLPVPPHSRPLPSPERTAAMAPPKRPPRPISGLLFDLPGQNAEAVSREVDTSFMSSLKSRQPPGQHSHFSNTQSGTSRAFEASVPLKREKRPPRLKEEALELQESDSNASRHALRGRDRVVAAKNASDHRSSMSPLASPNRILRTSVEVRANPRDSKMEISPTFVMGESLARRIAIKKQILDATFSDSSSPYRLSMASEVGKGTRLSQIKSPLVSQTPTHIRLRGGSIVTVSPPEEDIYHRPRYIQGPIRLAKGHVVLRKNSLASLEPFQSAVDNIYQDGVSITKRQGEMAAADDICSFFSSFALSDYQYEGTVGMREGASNSDASDEEIEIPDTYHDSESPPDSPIAWRVGNQSGESTLAMMPPVQNEEMLRVKGIGWLAKQRMRQEAEKDGQDEIEEKLSTAPWIKSVGEYSGAVMLRRNSQ